MKKFISAFLAIVILITLTLPAFAENSVTFSIPNAEVFAGDEVTIDIFISANSLLKSAKLLVKYDSKSLYFLDYYLGAIASQNSVISVTTLEKGNDAYVQIDYNDSKASLSADGKLISLIFAAKDEAVGKSNISITAENGKIVTASGSVTPVMKSGQLNIINNTAPLVTATATVTEESSTSDVVDPVSTSNSSTTAVTSTSVQATQNKPSNGKTERNSSFTAIVIAIVILVIALVALLGFENFNKKSNKRKKRKKKKTRR